MSVRGVLLVSFLLGGCASTTLPRSGLSCPDDAIAKTANDGERGSREWCEIPSGKKDCQFYAGTCEVPGTSHGPWIHYYPSGVRAEQSDVDHGKIHGRYFKFFESGKTQMLTEWRDYRREGYETRWHENGVVEWRGLYLNNRRDGEWSAWFPNGHAAFSGVYRQNEPIGVWKFWKPDGSISRVEDFGLVAAKGQDPKLPNGIRITRGFEDLPATHEFWIDGIKHGPWRTFDENGVLKSVDVYSAGSVVEKWTRP